MRVGLCITILTVISFLILPLASSAQSLNFTISCPNSVYAEDEVSFGIDVTAYNTSSTYDVKAYINDDVLASSELYDFTTSKWRSPQNYIIAAFPGHTEFKVKSHFVGETKICVKLRKTSQTSYTEVCNNITVNPAKSPPKEENKSEENNSSQDDDSHNSHNSSGLNRSTSEPAPSPASNSSPASSPEKIVLSPKKSLSVSEDVFTTKNEKTRLAIVYGFTIICVVALIILALRLL